MRVARDADIAGVVAAAVLPRAVTRLGVAVSGGGDSMALLVAAAELAQEHGLSLHAITVDHGLRADVADELHLVRQVCGDLRVSHQVEKWIGWEGEGNLQDAARTARYEIIAHWAQRQSLDLVLVGHTADDQAETLLMRLARGAGVDGLSAMPAQFVRHDMRFARPLLQVRRADLRTFLATRNVGWAEDPSNADRRFERIRMRDLLADLEPLGFDVPTLVQVAQNMQDARAALEQQAFLAAQSIVRVRAGAVAMNHADLMALPTEICRRLLVRAVMWLTGADYAPRGATVEQAIAAVRAERAFTLAGCQIESTGSLLWVFREHAALAQETCEVGDLWDGRWIATGPEDDPKLQVRALGAGGLSQVPDWRAAGLPRAAAIGLPGVWEHDSLVSAPVIAPKEGWQAALMRGEDAFFAALLSQGSAW